MANDPGPWWTVPEWWSAVGAVGALLAAVGAAFIAYRVYRIERRRDLDRATERRSAQAQQIAAWVTVETIKAKNTFGFTGPVGAWAATVRNASQLPIYNVMVLASHPDGAADLDVFDLIPPGETRVATFGELPKRRIPSFIKGIPDAIDATPASKIKLKLSFSDAAEYEWTRWGDGKLRPLVVKQPGPFRRLGRTMLDRSAITFYTTIAALFVGMTASR